MTKRSASEFETLAADAVAHHRAGRMGEAEAAYRAALEIAPGHAVITHNLGVIAAAQGRHEVAVHYFDEALAAESRYASAHYNRGAALEALARPREAIKAFERACVIEPENYQAHRALGFLWLGQGDRGRALDHFARTYELRRGDDRTGLASNSLTRSTHSKLLHDGEQFRFLAGRRRDRQRFESLARAYEEVASDFPNESTPLSDEQLERLGEDYNTAIHISAAPEIAGRAVSERPDRDAIMGRYREHRTGAAAFDDLLTPPALAGLKRYLLESTVWHDFNHIGGFVASYLEDGLACPLLLQIADEIRRTFPELLEKHPLSQAWAFKGLEAMAAVEAHADDAAVSVNFWVTPDEANLRPDAGGLVVCRVPPPADWEVRGYDADKTEVAAFLDQHLADSLIVPYRDNRAVLFESRLFHRSDAPEFASGYENHRINLTLLFGRHAG
jgi:tetratricopeptide (TPR) repeat protein